MKKSHGSAVLTVAYITSLFVGAGLTWLLVG